MFVLLSLFVISCGSANVKDGANDPTPNQKIVASAKNLAYECPDYFIPLNVFNPNNLIKSTKGTVAWTPSSLVGSSYSIDSKDSYIRRLTNASIPNQTSYEEYKQIDDAGFPGRFWYDINNVYREYPEKKYQAGFVCYGFVARAMKDAGITIENEPVNSIYYLLYQCTEITEINTDNVKPGDFVVYNIAGDAKWDHMAIITKVNSNDPENWEVISSYGIVEQFEYGVKKTKLGAFQGVGDGGIFQYWNPDWVFEYKIYTNREI